MEDCPLLRLMKFDPITNARHAHRAGKYAQTSANEQAASFFLLTCIMAFFMQYPAFCRAQVLLPDLLDVDQSPLTTAEGKMLDA